MRPSGPEDVGGGQSRMSEARRNEIAYAIIKAGFRSEPTRFSIEQMHQYMVGLYASTNIPPVELIMFTHEMVNDFVSEIASLTGTEHPTAKVDCFV